MIKRKKGGRKRAASLRPGRQGATCLEEEKNEHRRPEDTKELLCPKERKNNNREGD